MSSEAGDVTQLLLALKVGDPNVEGKLIPLVYDELRRLGAHYLRNERADHTLEPTSSCTRHIYD